MKKIILITAFLSSVFTNISFGSVDLKDVTISSENPSKTIEVLKDAKINFNDSVKVRDTTFYLSQTFEFGDQVGDKKPKERRLGFFYIVEMSDNQKFLRFAYQSGTHGLFRVAPFIIYYGGFSLGAQQEVLTVSWFSKGIGEGSLGLPAPVQVRAFDRMNKEQPELLPLSVILNSITSINESLPDDVESIEEFFEEIEDEKERLRSLMAEEVSLDANFLDKDNFIFERRKFEYEGELREANFISPSSVSFAKESLAPNFKKNPSLVTTTTHKYYDKLSVEVYPSYDESIDYLVFKDSANRIWISRTEVKNSKLTSYGVYSSAIDDDDSPLTLPLFERKKKIHPDYYVLEERPGKFSRFSSWGYLKDLDVIKSYYSSKGIGIPTAIYISDEPR